MKENQTPALKAFLNQTHQDIFEDKSGTPADYIPELAIVNPDQFGMYYGRFPLLLPAFQQILKPNLQAEFPYPDLMCF